ncbi:lytic transglycosylase [Brevirhabdus pacifica]|uniref:Lytic transglycosylase n=1 Tax=Brevirhabdus pacifica TaxID=1267768 RepID=A0A1U7DIN0_9RHOB|nr:lytic transglycosylase [Brevirhabdus pacifica]APX89728.1 lytic transglycosylase [Brevirhabdus pacifica]OWU74566.1 lytic transglycosylase [Loktanella sp. 22II-4b]PJJ85581.1 hypothetical protein CLV77_0100 [Brevirhabdus pacifica]
MSRLIALSAFLFLAACSGSGYSPPRNLDNACEIVRERPAYLKAMKKTQRKWGVPVATQMAVIYQESKFIGDARTPHKYALGVIPMGRQSSAYGYAQALDGTWDEYLASEGGWRAKRHKIEDATDFIGWYFSKTAERNGVALNDTRNQYLAYHEGRTGYARGSYRSKPWLMTVSDKLQDRAVRYHMQLLSCRQI